MLSYFWPVFLQFWVFYSLFNHYYSTQEHSLEIFSLASLGIKIFFVHIMVESIVNVRENKLFSCYFAYFLGLQCPIFLFF